MFLIISLLESRIKLTIINNATLQHGWLLNISSAYRLFGEKLMKDNQKVQSKDPLFEPILEEMEGYLVATLLEYIYININQNMKINAI